MLLMPKFDVSLDESVAILKQVLPLMSQPRAAPGQPEGVRLSVLRSPR